MPLKLLLWCAVYNTYIKFPVTDTLHIQSSLLSSLIFIQSVDTKLYQHTKVCSRGIEKIERGQQDIRDLLLFY
jgi:hypothetical protein